MKFVIEQIALRPADRVKAFALLRDLGAINWSDDTVVARGAVRGEEGQTNVAQLSFNYEMSSAKPLELELINYEAGRNWLDHYAETSIVTHLGCHCEERDLIAVRRVMANHDVKIVQEVVTSIHTNPAIKDTRRYRYVIYGTRHILGVDLKFIIRREVAPPRGRAAARRYDGGLTVDAPLVQGAPLLRCTIGTEEAYAEASLVRLEGRPEVLLTDVYADPAVRGRGFARLVIETLLEAADKQKLTVVTYAQAHGRPRGLSNGMLRAFYRRCGFGAQIRHSEVGWLFIRYPSL